MTRIKNLALNIDAFLSLSKANLKVATFLALRYVRRTSPFTSGLTIFIMTLTFLNLVVVTGILVGLIEGSSRAYRGQYSGDIMITKNYGKDYIEETPRFIETISALPSLDTYSVRYSDRGIAQSNYLQKVNNPNIELNQVGAEIIGINPINEDNTTHLSKRIKEGNYLSDNEEGYVLVGAQLVDRYSTVRFAGFDTMSDVHIGEKIRIIINGSPKEMTVKGIIKAKTNPVDLRIYMVDRELRRMLNRSDYSANEIAIKLKPGSDPEKVATYLKQSGLSRFGLIRTWEESQGVFFEQIKSTFNILGNMIGSIALVVASITVFIVVFITAITRRKYIGILKGIGISGVAIEISYVMLSIFYAVIGISIGMVLLYGLIKPYMDLHPINFPFSDGILVATYTGTIFRSLLILIATIIAGYIPARIIVQKNTLDAILGR